MDIDMTDNTPSAASCAPYAPLLPLLHAGELRLDDRPDLRDHLASCGRCQARLAGYDVVDGALRRQFAGTPSGGTPFVSFVDIAQRVAHEDDGEGTGEDARDVSTVAGAPLSPVAQRGSAHRWLSAVGPIAAVLVISILAAVLFAQRQPGGVGKPSSIPGWLHGKTVYVGTDDGVYAVRADDGSLRWHYPGGASTTRKPQPISAIALANETLYVADRPYEYGGSLGAAYVTIQAIRASDGALGWHVRIPGVSATLVIADGVIFTSVTETWENSDANRFVYALRASDGKQVGRYRTDEPILSAPAVADGVVYVGTTSALYAYRVLDGARLWRIPLGGGPKREGYQPSTISGAAIFAQGGFVYVNTKQEIKRNDNASHYEPTLSALRADGEGLWGSGADGTGGDALRQAYTPTVVNGVVYAESSGGLWATRVGSSTPRAEWFHRSDSAFVGPVAADGVVYACDLGGYTYALRASDGNELWHRLTQGGTMSQPPAVGGGAVFADGGSALYALRADDGAVLWRFLTNADVLRTSPIVGP
ncbi:MAG: outer membrane protein assembly factor BamB family protein [Ktedonobacterales bacterium]